MPENLLDSFDDIVVDNTQRISQQDRQFCDTVQKRFEATLSQIFSWQKKLQAEKPGDAYYVNRGKANQRDRRYNDSIYDYSDYEFSPLFGLEAIQSLYVKLTERVENDIIGHFNQTYGCNFKSKDAILKAMFGEKVSYEYNRYVFKAPDGGFCLLEDDYTIPSYELVVDYIIEELGGKSFAERRRDIKYGNLANHVRWNTVTRTRCKVKIPSLAHFLWNEDKEANYDTTRYIYEVLESMCVLFESDTVPGNLPNRFFVGADYPVNCCGCDSLRVYKNRSVEFTMESEDKAIAFQKLCDCLKESFRC